MALKTRPDEPTFDITVEQVIARFGVGGDKNPMMVAFEAIALHYEDASDEIRVRGIAPVGGPLTYRFPGPRDREILKVIVSSEQRPDEL